MNKLYRNLVHEELFESNRDYYEVSIVINNNTSDLKLVIDSVLLSLSDELFFLVLCYLNTTEAFGYYYPDDVFGNNIENDVFFKWIKNYCIDNNIILDTSRSICEVEVKHYTLGGSTFITKLPNIDEIFDTQEEMINYMNKLYEQN